MHKVCTALEQVRKVNGACGTLNQIVDGGLESIDQLLEGLHRARFAPGFYVGDGVNLGEAAPGLTLWSGCVVRFMVHRTGALVQGKASQCVHPPEGADATIC